MLKHTNIVESVRNPKWARKDQSVIDCYVKFNHIKNEVPFSANPNDCERHGREIFHRCRSGEFGPIGAYDGVSLHPSFQQPRFQQTLPIWFINQFAGMLKEANSENHAGTARGIVLVWGAFLEEVLKGYIEGSYQNQNLAGTPSKTKRRMTTLGGKIEVAQYLGLLNPEVKENLNAIKELRNVAAHSLHFSDFSHINTEKAKGAYNRLYSEFAADTFHEVANLLFVARFIYGTACQMVSFELALWHDNLLRP